VAQPLPVAPPFLTWIFGQLPFPPAEELLFAELEEDFAELDEDFAELEDDLGVLDEEFVFDEELELPGFTTELEELSSGPGPGPGLSLLEELSTGTGIGVGFKLVLGW